MAIVHSIAAILPPKAFKRWNNIFEKAFNLMRTLIAHLDSVGNSVQQFNRALIFSTLFVGIPLAANCYVIHFRNSNDCRFVFRHIKFLVFFLIIKSHA